MILEEETFEKFGYYPSDLTHRSHKWVIAKCDDCGKIREQWRQGYRSLCHSCAHKGKRNHFYGQKHTKKTKQKMRDNHADFSGEKHPMFGKHLSEEAKQKIGDANKGRLKGCKSPQWKPKIKCKCAVCGKEFEVKPSVVKRGGGKYCSYICSRKLQKIPTRKTKPEILFEKICRKNCLNIVKYTGDGTVWIDNINPDFIINHGKRIAIFINGDYWHGPFLRPEMKESQYPTYQIKTCKKHRWIPLILWESDIKRSDAESFILSQLNKLLK